MQITRFFKWKCHERREKKKTNNILTCIKVLYPGTTTTTNMNKPKRKTHNGSQAY